MLVKCSVTRIALMRLQLLHLAVSCTVASSCWNILVDSMVVNWTRFPWNQIFLDTSFSLQGDHLSGKPGNVREFDSCQGNVRDFTKNKGNVREKSCQGNVA